jgi:hypothetical protein
MRGSPPPHDTTTPTYRKIGSSDLEGDRHPPVDQMKRRGMARSSKQAVTQVTYRLARSMRRPASPCCRSLGTSGSSGKRRRLAAFKRRPCTLSIATGVLDLRSHVVALNCNTHDPQPTSYFTRDGSTTVALHARPRTTRRVTRPRIPTPEARVRTAPVSCPSVARVDEHERRGRLPVEHVAGGRFAWPHPLAFKPISARSDRPDCARFRAPVDILLTETRSRT